MLKKIIGLACFSIIIISCKNEVHIDKIEGKRISISDSLESNSAIEAYIKPYREHVNNDLDSVLAYSAETYDKTNGDLNTAIGNFMADAVYEQANPVFKSRTDQQIDMVLLNYGGIRSIISKGPITARTAYEVMPFENSIVVVAMKGPQIQELISYLANSRGADPISGLQLTLTPNGEVASSTINNEPIDENRTYYVATNDYLYNGGGNMTFFQKNEGLTVLDYKIRNALIDYFKKIDTLQPVIDNRFIKLKK
ncbi:5'-nucleotidase C-terminal domain-containing protein [Winogradskyella sp. A3E31]|uniref:5'-nucleotidase C-terminal domain-containing protein n=1 Tax=Winogradskyella sp. A3E31 TaxID=3349637 RepID=UPI00398B515E